MKKNLVVLSIVAVMTLMAGFSFAGVGVRMHISVPFDFYAGGQQLPAGEYEIEMGSGLLPTTALVTVRTENGTAICILNTKAGSAAGPSANHLRFNKYGDKHFLSGVSIQGFKAGFRMLTLERELKAQVQKEQSSVVFVAQK